MAEIGSARQPLPYKPLVRPSSDYEQKWQNREHGGAVKEQRAEERRQMMESRRKMKEAVALAAIEETVANQESSASCNRETTYEISALLKCRPSSSSPPCDLPVLNSYASEPADEASISRPAWAPPETFPRPADQPFGDFSAWVDQENAEAATRKVSRPIGGYRYQDASEHSKSPMPYSHLLKPTPAGERDYGAEAKAKRAEERKKLAEERRRANGTQRTVPLAEQVQTSPSPADPCTTMPLAEETQTSRSSVDPCGTLPSAEQTQTSPSSAEHRDVYTDHHIGSPKDMVSKDTDSQETSTKDDAVEELTATVAFAGEEWGADYVVVSVGDRVHFLKSDEGWYFVRHVGEPRCGPLEGWCPPAYLENHAQSSG